ncbi:MAG TPA: heavy-metal-associated domain-containing protein [Verrucomicrobiota bacterium]|nr:heavy-metal-associated domain-containing protein [Verrucomicrobiota bacterium]HNT14862.1 heavy-metal-associated domain-containing protein [Verrucomicrobiota bacterium]
MKTKLLFTLLLGGLWGVGAGEQTAVTANATNRFKITGMHCDGCAGGLTAELKETRGVVRAQVTFANRLAVVAYDTNRISAAQLVATIKKAGYTAQPVRP